MRLTRREFVSVAACAAAGCAFRSPDASEDASESRLVYMGAQGKLVYVPDSHGNIVPDFSCAGYAEGGVTLPSVPVQAEVSFATGDATERIQAAIDKVSALPLRNGVRGAVLVRKGRHSIAGSLNVRASGIVLRGDGTGEDGTILIAAGRGKRNLIQVRGEDVPKTEDWREVVDEYVPVGARRIKLASTKGLAVGDNVLVRRNSNRAWIHEIAMDRIAPRIDGAEDHTKQWEPFVLDSDRVITGIDGDTIEVNAPIVCAIEKVWGGGAVARSKNEGKISNVGVEELRGQSEFDRSVHALWQGENYFSDEDHAWNFIAIDHAVNAWVRGVKGLHFGRSCVDIERGAKRVTVEDCECLDMVSILTGERRYAFHIEGQQILVQRCNVDTARHSFVLQMHTCGPNVFLDCNAGRQYATSEPHHRWSVGGLFDNVHADIALQDRQWYGTGHGWSGANYVAWNCEGSLICQHAPTAENYAFGQVGKIEDGPFPRPKGHMESVGKHVSPRSLYRQQLKERLKLNG